MDTEVPEAGEDAQMMPESTTTETMGQENTATPKEAKERPNTMANRDQALVMIYNAIVESNNKVDRISQELQKVQAQNAVLTRELHQVHQWIGACVKMQGGKGIPRPPPEPIKQSEKLREKPLTKGIEDSIHAPRHQDMEMIDIDDKTSKAQNHKGKQPEKTEKAQKDRTQSAPPPPPAKPAGLKMSTGGIGTSPALNKWNQIHLKHLAEWGKEFTQGGIRAADRKKQRKEANNTSTDLLHPTTPSNNPRERQILLERDSEAKKITPEHEEKLIFQINLALTTKGVPEHIRIDTTKPTAHGNWSLYSKPKANANMLTHPEIKKIILEAARKIDPAIINVRAITQWPKTKIHQIPISPELETELKSNHGDMQRIYQASGTTMDDIKLRIESEYAVTINSVRWIKSVTHLMEQARQGTLPKHTTVVAHVCEEKAKDWMAKRYAFTGRSFKVEKYTEENPAIMCRTCFKHRHSATTCKQANDPRCGYCAGKHHTDQHRYKVQSCSTVGLICKHTLIKCSNCGGPHPAWNKRECEVRQAAITESHKKRAELAGEKQHSK
jgi:hypothetical protein